MAHVFMYCHLEKATRDQQEQLVNKLCLLAGTGFYSYPNYRNTEKMCCINRIFFGFKTFNMLVQKEEAK